MSKEVHSDRVLNHALCRAQNSNTNTPHYTPLGSSMVDGEQFSQQIDTGRWGHVGLAKTVSSAERMTARKRYQFFMKNN